MNKSNFRIELIWNREFDWCNFGPIFENKDDAIAYAEKHANDGDGARIKKYRIIDEDNNIIYKWG